MRFLLHAQPSFHIVSCNQWRTDLPQGKRLQLVTCVLVSSYPGMVALDGSITVANTVIDPCSRRDVEVMKKELMICFRTSEDLRKPLKKIAGQERRSLSGLILNVLSDYLKHKGSSFSDEEKRHYARRKVSFPALVSLNGTEGPHAGVVLDISLGGIKLSVPKESRIDIREDDEETRISILLTLHSEKTPVALTCRPNRAHPINGDIEVAGPFADCDFPNYQKVQNYLLQ